MTSTRKEPAPEALPATDAVVAVYSSHSALEDAIKELQRSRYDMKKLSIVAKDYYTDQQVVGYYNVGDRMKYWGKMGAFWGGLWGLLIGAAFFWVPGVGPLLVAGPVAAWILAALEGAVVVGGVSALGAGLYGIGIPKDSVVRYETAIKAGKYLLICHGTGAEVARAREILDATTPDELTDHMLDPVGQPAA